VVRVRVEQFEKGVRTTNRGEDLEAHRKMIELELVKQASLSLIAHIEGYSYMRELHSYQKWEVFSMDTEVSQ
jgi:hypothetical protein